MSIYHSVLKLLYKARLLKLALTKDLKRGSHSSVSSPNTGLVPDDLLRHYTSLQTMFYLAHCQKLGILDVIPTENEKKLLSVQDISRKCNIKNTDNLSRTLRFLSLFGYTKRIKNQSEYCYVHTDLSKQYAKNGNIPYNLWAYYSLALLSHPVFIETHFSVNEWIINDRAPFKHYYKKPLFGPNSFVEQKDDKSTEFVLNFFPFLQHSNTHVMDNIPNYFDFSAYNVICDVGAGIGQMCAPILSKYGNIKKAIIFDTKNVIQQAEQASLSVFGENNIVNGRVQYVVGDFFDAIDVDSVDVYLLRYILHDCDDDKCLQIISNVRKSMNQDIDVNDKRMLVVEMLMKEEDEEYDANNILDVNCVHQDMVMSLMFNGRERTLSEYDDLMTCGGDFERVSARSMGLLTLIEYKPI